MIATDAVISLVTSVIKISVFGLAGVVTAQVLAFALLIGVVALPGAFLARAFVERMPVHIHTAILDVAVITGGLVMMFVGDLAAMRTGCVSSMSSASLRASEVNYGHFTSGGIDDRIESTLPPVFRPKMVPRSYSRLNST